MSDPGTNYPVDYDADRYRDRLDPEAVHHVVERVTPVQAKCETPDPDHTTTAWNRISCIQCLQHRPEVR